MLSVAVDVSPLLERDELLARLRAVVDRAVAGHGQLVLLTGEAGVGKTALVERARQEAAGLRVWAGACERLFAARPLGPVVDIASKIGGRLEDVVSRGGRVHEVLPVLLSELLARPTLLVIEDVHWADEATLDVIALLARRMSATCSVAIVSYRDDELTLDHPLRQVLGSLTSVPGVERLRLTPLSLDAVRELAAPHGVDTEELFRRTGGNPFYVTEVLATAATELPPSVRDAVWARASGLDAGARCLLEAISIVPGCVPLGLLSALGGVHTDHLAACLASGMLVEMSDGIGFRHELARAAIADRIDPLRRVGLHRIALRTLRTAGADAARLAHHAEAAGDIEAVEELAPLAAARAAASGAHREAAAQFDRALRFGVDLPPERRAELLERGAHECYLIDRFDQGIAWLDAAVELHRLSGNVIGQGDALRQLSALRRCGGHREGAATSGHEAVALLESQPPGRELAAAYANVAMLALNSSDADACMRAALRALDLAVGCRDRDVIIHALNTIGTRELIVGDERGLALLERSLEMARTDGNDEHVGRAYLHLMDVAQRNRRWDLVDRYFGPAIEYCSEHGLDLWGRYVHVYRARTELDRGRWAEAVTALPTSVDGAATPLPRIVALVVLSLVRARRGDPGQWEALDDAAVLAERSGELQWLAPVVAARAEASWLSGGDGSIATESGPILQACIDNQAAWWAGEIAWWRRCAGIEEPAPPNAAEPWARQLAGEPREAAAAWRRAGCPYEEAMALAESTDPDDLRLAFERFDSLGGRPAAAIVARRMRAVGVRAIPRGTRPTPKANPAGLTPRELDVLRLVARGLRNTEIAEHLVVSAKTVDHHVSSVLAKLGVSGRAAAAREAIRLGVHDGEAATRN
jgi:DNA-binding CsgD family transcriptional regulator